MLTACYSFIVKSLSDPHQPQCHPNKANILMFKPFVLSAGKTKTLVSLVGYLFTLCQHPNRVVFSGSICVTATTAVRPRRTRGRHGRSGFGEFTRTAAHGCWRVGRLHLQVAPQSPLTCPDDWNQSDRLCKLISSDTEIGGVTHQFYDFSTRVLAITLGCALAWSRDGGPYNLP